MRETVQEIIGWGYPLASVVVIIIAATRRRFPGKSWLVAYLAIGLVGMLAWRIPPLLRKFDAVDFNISWFYEYCALPLNIIGLAGFCLLIPFVLAVATPSHIRSADTTGLAQPPVGHDTDRHNERSTKMKNKWTWSPGRGFGWAVPVGVGALMGVKNQLAYSAAFNDDWSPLLLVFGAAALALWLGGMKRVSVDQISEEDKIRQRVADLQKPNDKVQ